MAEKILDIASFYFVARFEGDEIRGKGGKKGLYNCLVNFFMLCHHTRMLENFELLLVNETYPRK